MAESSKNYKADGGNKWVIGGTLEALPDADIVGIGGDEITPVQTTGQSTTDIMSQKAVTDSLPHFVSLSSDSTDTNFKITVQCGYGYSQQSSFTNFSGLTCKGNIIISANSKEPSGYFTNGFALVNVIITGTLPSNAGAANNQPKIRVTMPTANRFAPAVPTAFAVPVTTALGFADYTTGEPLPPYAAITMVGIESASAFYIKINQATTSAHYGYPTRYVDNAQTVIIVTVAIPI